MCYHIVAVLPHHGTGTKQAWKQVYPHGHLEAGNTPIMHETWHSHTAIWWHWDIAGPQKLCLCCHVVALGHSVGRYSCFCVIRRWHWISEAFRWEQSSPHVSTLGHSRYVNKDAVPPGVAAAGTQILMLPDGFARTWQMQELTSHVMALGHKHGNRYTAEPCALCPCW